MPNTQQMPHYTSTETLTAGVALRHLTPSGSGIQIQTSYGNEAASGCQGKKASYTPYVVWSESCPFSKELGKLTKQNVRRLAGTGRW